MWTTSNPTSAQTKLTCRLTLVRELLHQNRGQNYRNSFRDHFLRNVRCFFVSTFIHPFNHLGVFIFLMLIFVFLYRRLICDRNATGFSIKRQNSFFLRYFLFKEVTLLREEIFVGRYLQNSISRFQALITKFNSAKHKKTLDHEKHYSSKCRFLAWKRQNV